MTSVGTVISFPVPLYANVQINADFYKPSRYVISNVTLGATTTVTTSVDHNYVIGQEVRLIIPPSFGCRQLNQVTGFVLSVPSTKQVELSIYSSGGNAYIASSNTTESAQIVAIGDINSGQLNSNGLNPQLLYIPGSFQNISPQ